MKIIAAHTNEQKRWCINKKVPEFARFKAHLRYYNNKFSEYPSLDYFYVYNNKHKIKVLDEERGLQQLLDLKHLCNKEERDWRFINIFLNLTNDLRTNQKNYNELVCTMTPNSITWNKQIKIFWIEEKYPLYTKRYVDVKNTLKWKELNQFEKTYRTEFSTFVI